MKRIVVVDQIRIERLSFEVDTETEEQAIAQARGNAAGVSKWEEVFNEFNFTIIKPDTKFHTPRIKVK